VIKQIVYELIFLLLFKGCSALKTYFWVLFPRIWVWFSVSQEVHTLG